MTRKEQTSIHPAQFYRLEPLLQFTKETIAGPLSHGIFMSNYLKKYLQMYGAMESYGPMDSESELLRNFQLGPF